MSKIIISIETGESDGSIKSWSDVAIALGLNTTTTELVRPGQSGTIYDDNGDTVGQWGVN